MFQTYPNICRRHAHTNTHITEREREKERDLNRIESSEMKILRGIVKQKDIK